ncbi:MAG: GNAT family N-acetyltransferase [Thiotrichales bacterium]|nr:MAG: GNAT family N-acetyltransferase [Thiotrichales bacterium]
MICEDEKLVYVPFDEIAAADFMKLLNQQKIREHLVEHGLFDAGSIKNWVKGKIEVDRTDGCRVRGIISENTFAGWCGLQLEDGKYEIAIVLDPKHWGIGTAVFSDIMRWAKELGHDEVFIHLLHTRPEYQFLRKIAKRVFESEQLGQKFTTYHLSVI